MSFDQALASIIDHTLLRPDAGAAAIDQLCDEARAFGFRTVCVQPTFVRRVAARLSGSAAGITAVVGFPHGASVTATKLFETQRALDDGATEIDMVANLGWIAMGEDATVADEVARVVATAATGGALVKVILETTLFSRERNEAAARAVVATGAAFLKTSTGYGPGGATPADVALLRTVAGTRAGVKASGGVKTRAQALALVAAGANRIGASGSLALVKMAAE